MWKKSHDANEKLIKCLNGVFVCARCVHCINTIRNSKRRYLIAFYCIKWWFVALIFFFILFVQSFDSLVRWCAAQCIYAHTWNHAEKFHAHVHIFLCYFICVFCVFSIIFHNTYNWFIIELIHNSMPAIKRFLPLCFGAQNDRISKFLAFLPSLSISKHTQKVGRERKIIDGVQ